MSVMTGALNLAASFMRRSAFRYPSGWGMPKLRLRFSFVSRPFWCPTTMTDTPAKPRPPADDRRVVHVEAVAVELDEVGEDGAEIVEGVRPAGVTGDHDALNGREIAVDLRSERLELGLQPVELTLDVDLPLRPDPLEVFDLPLQLEQRLLELQRIG